MVLGGDANATRFHSTDKQTFMNPSLLLSTFIPQNDLKYYMNFLVTVKVAPHKCAIRTGQH